MSVPKTIEITFIEIYHHLYGKDIRWALTGSLAFAIQGFPLKPKDIDIQTDRNGAFAIERLFEPNMRRPVQFSEAERIRSYFGEFRLNGVKVEIMGDVQKRIGDGEWDASTSLPEKIVKVSYYEMKVPVLSLDYEIASYRKMGRRDRAEQLEKWRREKG